MNGTINVINQANSLTGTNATAGSPDTVGTLMVPAQDLDQYVSTLTSKGFTIDRKHIHLRILVEDRKEQVLNRLTLFGLLQV